MTKYRVLLDVDRWDPDLGRITVTVWATGPAEARAMAKRYVSADYPSAVALTAEEAAE